MTVEAFLDRLEGVRSRGTGKWSARCPAHHDKSPSLSVREAERGLLVHCFAGCTLVEVMAALNLPESHLFHDAPDSHASYRERRRRTEERQRKAQYAEVDGFTIDALREADYFVRSRQGLDISAWTQERLHNELDALAEGYALLWAEELASWT